MPAADNRVRLDLNSPEFQEVFFRLEPDQLKQVVSALGRLHELDWNALYRHTGFRWEAIGHVNVGRGGKVYSLRLISLHPDHDSTYER